jgi:hypothetical protein
MVTMMKDKVKTTAYLALLLIALLQTGCFFTSQSYNHGKLLNPGESLFSYGTGIKSFTSMKEQSIDSAGISIYSNDSTIYKWVTLCIDYRLGFLEKYPFGKGIELGFHIEEMLRSYKEKYDWGYSNEERKQMDGYPPIVEVSARLGIKDITAKRSIYHHNIGLGWIIGLWIDNGWLIEYACGFEFEKTIPYLSIRGFLSPTNSFDSKRASFIESNSYWKHDRKANIRTTCGISLKLPERIPVIPDFISPECSLIFPNNSIGNRTGYSFSIGLRWLNGI